MGLQPPGVNEVDHTKHKALSATFGALQTPQTRPDAQQKQTLGSPGNVARTVSRNKRIIRMD
jgi:hypothetical protein